MSSEIIYYDALITNQVIVNGSNAPKINYNDNRSAPLIKNTTGYEMSIIRFSLSSQTLPIFTPSVLSILEPNKTIYSITMSYNGISYQQYLTYSPQSAASVSDDNYYNIYNYQYVIYLANQCLQDCLLGLDNLVVTPINIAPVISINLQTQLMSIAFDTDYYGFNENDKINVYFNYSMMSLFDTFPIYIMKTGSPNGSNYQLDLRLVDVNGCLNQELVTLGSWSPVNSIVFTSNLLPVVSSQIGSFNNIIDGVNNSGNSSNQYLNIITDFIGNDLTFTPFIQYSPYIYRFISLKPNAEIKNIDIQVYWKSKHDGSIRPVYLSSGGSMSLKIMFRPIQNN